jgi:hypothetical protein
MNSSVKKRTQNLLHEDWISTKDRSALCTKIYKWLEKYFIGTTARALFTNDSAEEQDLSRVENQRQEELPLRQRDEALDRIDKFLASRIRNYKESDKIKHQFFMLLGGSGFGKTRMARELERRARVHHGTPQNVILFASHESFINNSKLFSANFERRGSIS